MCGVDWMQVVVYAGDGVYELGLVADVVTRASSLACHHSHYLPTRTLEKE
jgi:hypothetical protein